MGFADLVIPENNEPEFIGMAGRLGLDGLCFLYERRLYKESVKRIKELETVNLPVYTLMLTEKPRRERIAVYLGRTDILKLRNTIVAEFESSQNRDGLQFRSSGLDDVACRLARKNSVVIGFSFSSILNVQYRTVLLGRMKQNIRFCRKFDVETVIATFARTPWEMRRPNDLAAFFTSMGMTPGEAKSSLSNLNRILSEISNQNIIKLGRITVSTA